MTESSTISPLLASSSTAPASQCRPPFSHARVTTRVSRLSFAAATGRDDELTPRSHPSKPRPMTARPGSAHRALSRTSSSTHWHFLASTPAKDQPTTPHPMSSRASRLRTRPATARVEDTTTTSSSPSVAPTRPLPKRPATCRGTRSRPSGTKPSLLVGVDPRVIHEAARRETEQQVYNGPLAGKSVEIQQPDLLAQKPFRDSCVANAISLSEFHRGRAFQARATGDQQRTIAHLEKLLTLGPHDHVALFQLAVAYEKTGRLTDAHKAYTRVLGITPDNPFVHFNLGNLVMQMGRVDDAIAAYTRAIQLQKHGADQVAFYRQRGAAFRQRGDFQKAASDYARVHAAIHQRTESLPVDKHATPNRGVADAIPIDVVDAMYSATPIYSTTHFAAHCSPSRDQRLTSSVEFLNHTRAMAIAAKPMDARTEDDLWWLGDELARRFSCCAALDPEARKLLSACVVAGARLPRGALLVHEGTERGRFMFFIARGRVAVYKRFAPLMAGSANDTQTTDSEVGAMKGMRAGDDAAVASWEMQRASGSDETCIGADEKEEAIESTATECAVVDVESWSRSGGSAGSQGLHQVLLTHLTAGDVCGRQWQFAHQQRLYSAVVSEPCDFFAISWADFNEVERLHRLITSSQLVRFLATVPLFHGLPSDELLALAQRAKTHKVVGERVVCTEGQHVNGLLIVREGILCQLSPSGLGRPPNFSVTFNLSGSISRNDRDAEDHGGRHFFTQLEHSDDPLLCLHDSAMMHGFLPRDFLPQALTRLSGKHGPPAPENEDERSLENGARNCAAPWIGAISLTRGAFFNASSTWIPPRKSRLGDDMRDGSGDFSCAKTALVTTESCELVFFTASDLTSGLSVESRTLLQSNMQQLNTRLATTLASSASTALASAGVSSLRKLVFMKPPPSDDLVRKFQHETDWKRYKQKLVRTIVVDTRDKRSRSTGGHELSAYGSAHAGTTARSNWK